MRNAYKSFLSWSDRFFMISERGSTHRTEVINGIVTFMTMSYILPVHSAMMAAVGLNQTGILLAVCIASGLATIAMGVYAKMPIGIAPGMGMNALMAYTYIIGMKYPTSFVLFCIFIEGVLFFIFSLTPVREKVIRAIPYSLKMGISFGIGLFVFVIGLQNSGIVVNNDSTLTSMINFRGDFMASFVAIMTILGLLIIAALTIKKVKGAMFVGMIAIWVIGIGCQVVGIYVPNPDAGSYSLIPKYTPTDFSTLGSVVGLCFRPDFQAMLDMGMTVLQIILASISVILSFFYTDCFDTAGTTTACAHKAGMLDENGNFDGMGKVMRVDAGSTVGGSVCSLSPLTAYVESGSGIVGGARTGLAAVVTGICFLCAMPFSSLLTATPTFATSAALLMVGILMMSAGKEIKWESEQSDSDPEGGLLTLLPVGVCAIAMPIFYSISEGIAAGIVTYVVLHVITGKGKKVNKLMYVLALIFILKYFFL